MALSDYEELAARSFDEHHDSELRAAVQVCADALAQIEDPRGPLISYEYALESAALRRRALELRRAMHRHANENGVELFGKDAAPVLGAGRTVTCEWRSGMLYGLSLDVRYLPAKAKLAPGDIVKIVLRAPVAKNLRRLRVRVRTGLDSLTIINMLGKRKEPLPLEEIEVGSRVWPERLQIYEPISAGKLVERYPNLYYLAGDDRIHPLPGSHKLAVSDLLLADAPTAVEPRRLLGRALTSADDKLREAALQRIAGLGPSASVFARVLGVLAQPRVITPILPVIAALRALGPSRETSLLLAKISSRTKQYDDATRSAAGAAAHATRLPSPAPG